MSEYCVNCEAMAKRAEQLQRDNEKLAAALYSIWVEKYYTWPQHETKEQALDRCIAEYLFDADISRETFDRLIGGGT